MNKILEIIAGSNLYGLNTENSDLDIFGIYLESKDEIIEDYFFNSNHKGREIDLSEVVKLSNGKNSPEAIDKKFFSFKKFVGRAINCNPNINECLFAPEDKILYVNDIGRELINLRKEFLSKKAFFTFGSYAKSQSKKARIKKHSFERLEHAQDTLENKLPDKEYLFYAEKEKWFTDIFDIKEHHYKIKGTDYQIVKNQDCKRSIKEIEKIIGQRSHRKEEIKSKGADFKFLSHSLRLLHECEDILLNQEIVLPLKDREVIYAMKLGKIDLLESEKIIDNKWKDVEKAYEISKLPPVANTSKIYSFIKEVYDENFK